MNYDLLMTTRNLSNRAAFNFHPHTRVTGGKSLHISLTKKTVNIANKELLNNITDFITSSIKI